MKNPLILCALLASACSSPSVPTVTVAPPIQVAITAYLKKTLDDPASYQPVHWGKEQSFQQREVDAALADEQRTEFEQQLDMARISTESMSRLNEIEGVSAAAFNRPKKAAALYVHRADSIKILVDKLQASTDTTRLGSSIWHAFRAKNKMGALVLDSARFIVKKSGEVLVSK